MPEALYIGSKKKKFNPRRAVGTQLHNHVEFYTKNLG